MFIDRPDILLKQFRHQLLREPNRLIFEPALNASLAVFGPVENDARVDG